MAVLLLRLDGPMQSWGTQSRFDDRDTERFPSKSGVIGLLCAALGRPRSAALDDLAALRMAARADRPGVLQTDYQTARDVPRAKGSGSGNVQSWRHYLSDACFLVGLESDDADLLAALHAALWAPVWPLYLGRKGHVPGTPVWLPDGLVPDPLERVMGEYGWLGRSGADRPSQLELEWECGPGEPGLSRHDVPLSFADGDRRFGLRLVRHDQCPCPARHRGEVCGVPEPSAA